MNLRNDLRFTLRTLARSRAWTAGVVLTLAIGIGLAVAVFTVADSLLIRPLAVRDPDRLVLLWGTTRDGRTDHFPFLYGDAREFARRTRTLDRVEFFSYGGAQPVPVDIARGVVRLRRSLVSGGYFDLLGVKPLLGRALGEADDARGAAPVAVLSYAGWRRFFGGDANVIGRRVVLHADGTAYTVVGVMPRGLDYPRGVDLWSAVVPNSKPLGDQPIYAELNAIGRLKVGSSVVDARDELTRFFATTSSVKWGVTGVVRTLTEDVVGNTGPAVLAFAAAAGLLLLITCINVANLLLVRGRARTRELAVRAALGAGRARLLVQLLTESALLAVAGGIAGTALAVAAVRAFVALAPPNTPRLEEIHIGAPIVLGAIGVTALATLLFAVLPTLVASRIDVQDALRSGTRSSGGSRSFRVGTQTLVVGQMALALVVLSVAGLVGRSLAALSEVPLTFDADKVLVVELALPGAYMGSASKQLALIEQLTEQLDAVHGVRAVAPVYTAPLAPVGGIFGRIPAEGQSDADIARNPTVDYEMATPDYFASFGIPLLRGRAFTNDDRDGSPSVAIVSEALARQYWPHDDPIGKRFRRGATDFITVVGVVADTHYRDLANPRPVVYLPLRQLPFPFAPTTLLIATNASPTALASSIRQLIDGLAPGVAVVSALPLESYAGPALAQPRMNALLLGIFAAAALVLAAVGLFGVMATTVRQRTRELGIRIALGATPEQLRASVLVQALTLAGGGLVTGFAVSLLTTRTLRSLLFQVSPTDIVTLACAGVLLLSVALLAAYVPARRAQRMDPVTALRLE